MNKPFYIVAVGDLSYENEVCSEKDAAIDAAISNWDNDDVCVYEVRLVGKVSADPKFTPDE